MAVRWTITFKTLSDKTGLVKVYDSTYSGTAIALTPAVNPFSVSCRQSELITPVVSDSGYLRIIDDGDAASHIEDLHPQGSMDRPVEFYIDNSLIWRGYISPETYTVDWTPAPRIVELPVVGVLDVLKSVNIEDTGTGVQTIATFLVEIMNATGFTFDGVLFPIQILQLGSYGIAPELRFSVSRYNFLRLNELENQDDEGWTEFIGESWYNVLQKICSYFGWTASAKGETLILTTQRTDITDFTLVAFADLEAIEDNFSSAIPVTYVERNTINSLSWDGVNHRRSISNGKRRITITTETPDPEGIYPELLFDGAVEFEDSEPFRYEVHPTGVDHELSITGRNKVLNINHEKAILHKYLVTDIGTSSEDYHEIDWSYPESVDDMVGPGAYIVKSFSDGWRKQDNVVVDGSDDPTVRENFVNAIRLVGNKGLVTEHGVVVSTPIHFMETVPLVSIKSRSKCRFPAGGVICINADVLNSYAVSLLNTSGVLVENTGMSMWGAFDANLKCSLRIGSAYYNGSSWVNGVATPPVFDVPCFDKSIQTDPMFKNGVGSIADRAKIKTPPVGIKGFFIPLSVALDGDVELTFYNWDYWFHDTSGSSFVSLYVSNVQFSYYSGQETKNKALRLSQLAGNRFQDDMGLSLSLSSNPDNKLSQSMLWLQYEPIGQSVSITYPGSLVTTQPEQWLMNTLLKLYSAPSEELMLEVDYDSTLNVYDLVLIGGKEYVITGRETDYASEHVKLYITSYE